MTGGGLVVGSANVISAAENESAGGSAHRAGAGFESRGNRNAPTAHDRMVILTAYHPALVAGEGGHGVPPPRENNGRASGLRTRRSAASYFTRKVRGARRSTRARMTTEYTTVTPSTSRANQEGVLRIWMQA